MIPSRQNWEIVYFPSNEWHLRILAAGKSNAEDRSDLHKYPNDLLQFIQQQKVDFVLVVCGGCTEAQFNQTSWPKGPRYITWSIDDYRLSERVRCSELHLTGLPTDEPSDIFIPLFQDPLPTKPITLREIELGFIYNIYDKISKLTNGYRENEVQKIKAYIPSLATISNIQRVKYLDIISTFKFGLNIGQFIENSLPNYRSFELGAAGVMPISPGDQKNRALLENLFEDHLLLYKSVEEIPEFLKKSYDASKLREYYSDKHSFQTRLNYIFRKFFGISFPLIKHGL